MAVIAADARIAEIQQKYPPRSAVMSWIFFDWAAQPYFTPAGKVTPFKRLSSSAEADDPVNTGDYWIPAFAGMRTSLEEKPAACINA